MYQFIKEFAFTRECDGTLYYDTKENFFVCVGYPMLNVPDRLELIISFKTNP